MIEDALCSNKVELCSQPKYILFNVTSMRRFVDNKQSLGVH